MSSSRRDLAKCLLRTPHLYQEGMFMKDNLYWILMLIGGQKHPRKGSHLMAMNDFHALELLQAVKEVPEKLKADYLTPFRTRKTLAMKQYLDEVAHIKPDEIMQVCHLLNSMPSSCEAFISALTAQ
ncbi:hypothetical protein AMTR_s00882p00010850 [Amborella trichopoda]|uniref:Uncharacterized protein n=1 Tax=Amborella trichopoda TaxID=13333 RepID=W1NP77_AMBTC|nr:hypothetical protein AMTR_s00882p00010850 [Amborella trichopoda]